LSEQQDLNRFRSELEKGVGNGPVRNLLLNLFLEQEKRFGMGREQLERVDRHIARLRAIIAGQVALVDRLGAKGLSTDQAAMVLDTLNDMMLVHQSYRHSIIDVIAH
jgi:hypothetical protein